MVVIVMRSLCSLHDVPKITHEHEYEPHMHRVQPGTVLKIIVLIPSCLNLGWICLKDAMQAEFEVPLCQLASFQALSCSRGGCDPPVYSLQ